MRQRFVTGIGIAFLAGPASGTEITGNDGTGGIVRAEVVRPMS